MRRLLLVDVRHALFTKGAVVEPVIASPAINHGIHRHRDSESRMRVNQSHQRQEPVIRNAQDADLAVALGNVFHQPVDRVVGVRSVVNRSGVERSVQRTRHDVVAL